MDAPLTRKALRRGRSTRWRITLSKNVGAYSNVMAGVIGTLAIQEGAQEHPSLYGFKPDRDIVAGEGMSCTPVLWDTESAGDSITLHLDPEAGLLMCTNNKIHSESYGASRSIRLPPGGGPWYAFVRLFGTVTLEFQPVRAKDDSAGQ